MKKLNKKLSKLAKLGQNGNLENFIDSLGAQAVSNYLHEINFKKRMIISLSFNEERKIINQIHEAEEENASFLKLSFLKDDLVDTKKERDCAIEFWEKIEKKLQEKNKYHKQKRKERIKLKTQ